MKDLRISSTNNLHPKDGLNPSEYVREGLRFMKECGFDAADFSMKIIENISDGWEKPVEEAILAGKEYGIKYELCHLPFDGKLSVEPERIPAFNEKMLRCIEAAAMLGVDYAVLHPNTWNIPLAEFDRKEQYDWVTRHFEPFVEKACKLGVRLAVENMRLAPSIEPAHRYCQDPDELCEIADAFGIGVCWDFGHANIGALRQSEALKYVGKRLKVLHVNDNNKIDDDHVPPFSGKIDWIDAMKGLSLAEFDGLFNYEIQTNGIPCALRRSFTEYLVRSARELISYI